MILSKKGNIILRKKGLLSRFFSWLFGFGSSPYTLFIVNHQEDDNILDVYRIVYTLKGKLYIARDSISLSKKDTILEVSEVWSHYYREKFIQDLLSMSEFNKHLSFLKLKNRLPIISKIISFIPIMYILLDEFGVTLQEFYTEESLKQLERL